MEKPVIISKKICLLGSFGVGKTSLVRRFVLNEFKEDYRSTLGVQIFQKTITIDKFNALKLILWDIAHIEKFDNMIKTYFRGSHGAIIVCDVTRPQSFQGTDVYLQPYSAVNPKSKLVFVGNKMDLVEKQQYDMEQLLQLSKAFNAPGITTSAKTNENIDELFKRLGEMLIRESS